MNSKGYVKSGVTMKYQRWPFTHVAPCTCTFLVMEKLDIDANQKC